MGNIFQDLVEFYRALPRRTKFILFATALLGIAVVVLFFVFEKPIMEALAPLAEKLRDMRFSWLVMIGLIIVTSFPPIPGYSSLLLVSGFIYGFPLGFLPAFAGAMLGSSLCFGLFRTTFRGYVDRLLKKDHRFAALALAIRDGGFKIIFLIRLSPFPFPISNAFFASIRTVSYVKFVLATLISLLKIFIHIFIGSRFGSLGKHHMDRTSRIINYVSISVGILIFAFAAWYLYRKTMQAAHTAAQRLLFEKDEEDKDLEQKTSTSEQRTHEIYELDDEVVINTSTGFDELRPTLLVARDSSSTDSLSERDWRRTEESGWRLEALRR